MSEFTARPEHIHALIVGIERYDAGADWDLNGPAGDALRFMNWLRSGNVPQENILLFLSPLDQNLQGHGPATSANIHDALTRTLPGKKGDLLFLFWGGHGMVTEDGARRLLYSDATQQDKRNLDVADMLLFLRSSYFAGLGQQICIIDSCASFPPMEEFRAPALQLPRGRPRKAIGQFAMMAARPGEAAKNIGSRGTGLFSEKMLDCLDRCGTAQLPPDMQAVMAELQDAFEVMREKGEAKQTPTFLWYADEEGNESTLLQPQPRHEFDGGPVSYTLCDREEQVAPFVKFFGDALVRPTQVPQAYVIHGDETERHESLVLRLINTVIRPKAEKHRPAGAGRSGVLMYRKVGWIDEDDPEKFRELFPASLFHAIDPSYIGGTDPIGELCRLDTLRQASPIILQHDIDANSWNRENIEWYLKSWSSGDPSMPQVILFLNIIFEDDPLWIRTFWRRRVIRKDLEKLAKASPVPLLVLPELQPPEPRDVGEWLKIHNVSDDPEKIMQLRNDVCSAKDLSMMHVESRLMAIYRSCTR